MISVNNFDFSNGLRRVGFFFAIHDIAIIINWCLQKWVQSSIYVICCLLTWFLYNIFSEVALVIKWLEDKIYTIKESFISNIKRDKDYMLIKIRAWFSQHASLIRTDRGFIKIQVSLMLHLYKASNWEKTFARPETCFIFIKDSSSNSQESKNIQSSKKS